MGRGLSPLQQYILAKAAASDGLHPANILAGYYGWQKIANVNASRGGRQRFSRRRIGEAKYSRTMAALSRSIRRLEERGLIERYEGVYGRWFILRATEKGIKSLSVNQATHVQPS